MKHLLLLPFLLAPVLMNAQEAGSDMLAGMSALRHSDHPAAEQAFTKAVVAEPADAGASAAVSGWQLVFKQGKAEQVLGFNFDEVREARLVPVVDFKGRKPRGDAAAGEQAGEAPDAAAAPGTDGG